MFALLGCVVAMHLGALMGIQMWKLSTKLFFPLITATATLAVTSLPNTTRLSTMGNPTAHSVVHDVITILTYCAAPSHRRARSPIRTAP